MAKNKWMCTCKSSRYYHHSTEVDAEQRCIHCKYYAIQDSRSNKKITQIAADFPEMETSYLSKLDVDLDYELDTTDSTDELLEYANDLKELEE